MELAKILKSKKGMAVLGLVVVIVVGFFALKFMSSTTEEPAEPDKPRAAHKTVQKPPAKTAKKDEPEKSPLFQAMQALKDPFQAEDPKAAELKEKLDLAKREVEYLKAILEEKKLKQEIKEIEQSLAQDQTPEEAGGETALLPSPQAGEKTEAGDGLVVKAILASDDQRSALLVSGGKSAWVHQGERFDGWEIKEIREQSVVVLKKGRTFVFFYDRPDVGREGDS
jgi:type IV pilus biogenesis protein PilP